MFPLDYVETAHVACCHLFNHQTHHRAQVHVMLGQTSTPELASSGNHQHLAVFIGEIQLAVGCDGRRAETTADRWQSLCRQVT